MRIFIITPWFPATPTAQSGNFILDAVNALIALNHDVKVLVVKPWHPAIAGLFHADWSRPPLQPEAYPTDIGLEQVHYISIPRNYLRSLSNWIFKHQVTPIITRITKSFKPDIILAHTEMIGMAAVKETQTSQTPVAVVLHGINTHPKLNSTSQLQLVKQTLNAANGVILVGTPLFKYFAKIANKTNNFHIIANGFRASPNTIHKKSILGNRQISFISVSNLHEGKGVDVNLQAFSQLYHHHKQTNWHYTIIGDGRERITLELMAQDLGIAKHVKFIGATSHDKVYHYLSQADVFTLPSYREAFGIVYLEAMACGLLTIGIDGQGPSDFITNNKTGFLIPSNDVLALKKCFINIFEHPKTMQMIAAQGYHFVHKTFTWENHAHKLANTLQEVINDSHV